MNRLFLDANVLFSASYRRNSKLKRLWNLKDTVLLTSLYAVEEARRNLTDDAQLNDLDMLISSTAIVGRTPLRSSYPELTDIDLPDKDWPILLAAVASNATHLITGDRKHFGQYYGKRVSGILIIPPATYLTGEPS